MLTIHGRTREEKGHGVGAADWETIRKIKLHFKGRIPIIANGGIETMDDFYRCIEQTGVDGIMTSGNDMLWYVMMWYDMIWGK